MLNFASVLNYQKRIIMRYISLPLLSIILFFVSFSSMNFSSLLCTAFVQSTNNIYPRCRRPQLNMIRKSGLPIVSDNWDKSYRLSFVQNNVVSSKMYHQSTRLFSSAADTVKDDSVIGFIGLGIMGNGMARCLLRENVPLKVWNRSIEKSEKIKSEYPELVTIASSPAEVVSSCPLTFSMLSTPEACKTVYSTENTGILAGVNVNTRIVDCATLECQNMIEFSSEVISRGGKFLEAPVSGSKGPAENGQLIFLSAGDENVYKNAIKYFEIMGKSSYHLGEVGKGTKMKLIVNMIMGSMLSSLAEGMSICGKTGLDNEDLIQILSQGAMANPMFNLKGPLISKDNHAPNFPLKHAHKDMKFAVSLAKKVGAQAKVAEESTKYMEKQIKKGDGDLDFSALAREVNEILPKSEISM